MNALIYNTQRRAINYIKKNYLIILLGGLPFLFLIFFVLIKNDIPPIPLKIDSVGFDAISVMFSIIYFIITLATIDYLPLTKSEASYFFTAPIRNQYTLFYLMMKSLATILFTLIIVAYSNFYYLPALFGFTNEQAVRFLVVLLFGMIMAMSLGFLLLAIKYKIPIIFNIVRYAILFAGLILFARIITMAYSFFMIPENIASGEAFGENVKLLINDIFAVTTNKIFYYTPFLGFVLLGNKFIFDGSIIGIVLMIISSALCIFATFKIDFSMTTKAFEIADKFEKMRGRKKGYESSIPDFFSTKAIDESKEIKGLGLGALFSKYIIEYPRRNNFLLSSRNIIALGIMLAVLVFCQFMNIQIGKEDNLDIMFMIILMVNYTLTLIPEKISDELYLPTMQILPISGTKKLFAQFFYNTIPSIIQGIICFIFFLIGNGNPLESLLQALLIFFVLSLCVSLDFLLGAIFSDNALAVYRLLFSIFIKIFAWMGAFISYIVSTEGEKIFIPFNYYIIVIGVSTFLIFIFVTITSVFLENK